jgi:type II secretory pathway component PulK
MIRRLLREERGMALGLAIIVVVIVGVLGAGLLTFVATDLEAIVPVNRGEQAFELAEAGIEVAKAHLANDSSPADWSSGELHMAGMGEGSVTVEFEDESGSFEAVSTGEYRETNRKIEATFSVEEDKPKLLSWRELYEQYGIRKITFPRCTIYWANTTHTPWHPA